jgi:hypothetical protein
MYDLAVQGYSDFSRYGTVLDKRKISLDPLSGVADGSNVFFQTTFFPILTSGSFSVYTSGSSVSGVADYDTGSITLAGAPLVQPKATYTFLPYTTAEMMQFLVGGFDEMESRWVREWKLTDATGARADENSAQLYVTDTTGSDPACGNSSFSLSRVQTAFYLSCTEYRFRLTQLGNSAFNDYMYRSTAGVTVDKSKRPQNMELLVRSLDDRVKRTLRMAQEQYYTDGSQWGSYVGGLHSADYVTNFEWQRTEVNSVAMESFNVSIRAFGGIY